MSFSDAELNVIADKVAERLRPTLEGMYDKTLKKKEKEKATLTYNEAAMELGRSVCTVRRLVKDQNCVVSGGHGYVDRKSIQEYLIQKGKA